MRGKKFYRILGRVALLVALFLGGLSMVLGAEEVKAERSLAYVQLVKQVYWIICPFALALFLLCDYKVTEKKRWAVWILAGIWLLGDIIYLICKFL